MKVDFLVNHPQKIKDVSLMVYDEFVVKENGKMTYEQVESYFSKTKSDSFPITFLALKDDECIETVSIFENDLKTQDELKPWLASLYVKPEYRSQGVGHELVRKTIAVAKDLGYTALYLRTEHASEYYRKRGWQFVSKAVDQNQQATEIFKFFL